MPPTTPDSAAGRLDVGVGQLTDMLARLPGLGPRSARRIVFYLLRERDNLMRPLARALGGAADCVVACRRCGNLDTGNPCRLCCDRKRDGSLLCVVEHPSDLWAFERSGAYRGRYFVLGGVLSALDGVGPEDLRVPQLRERVCGGEVAEVILATNATVDGQTTAYYIAESLRGCGVKVSRLSCGLPLGGELDYLDDGTLAAAFTARRPP